MGKILSPKKWDGPWKHLFAILGATAPWIALLLMRPRERWRELWSTRAGSLLLLGVIAPPGVLSLFASKHGKYILPLYPASTLRWEEGIAG